MDNTKLRNQFDKVKRIADKNLTESMKLDEMIRDRWEYHYSEYDIDEIIDTLDYGTAKISFKEFLELMDSKGQSIHNKK